MADLPRLVPMVRSEVRKNHNGRDPISRCCQSNANQSPLSEMPPLNRRTSDNERLPLSQSSGAMEFEGLAVDQVALRSKVVVERGVN
jgi:hypothetical protein